MTEVIFAQVIFSRLGASSYNFENTEKHNMNLHFIEQVFCQNFLFTLVIRKSILGTFFWPTRYNIL